MCCYESSLITKWGAAALEPAAAAEVALGNPNDYYVSGYSCAKYPKTV
jgi:hypothetical protein